MIVLYILGLLVVAGIIRYLLIPVAQAAKHGLIDGYNGTTQYKHLYIKDVETLESVENDQSIEDEIIHLEVLISRYNDMAVIIENELEYCTNDKKRLVLLNRLNTIDNQTFKLKRKIDKLQEKLE